VESNLGDNQGNFSVIESLATLAYDGRRSRFFREQLLDAFRILQDEDMSADELVGSWAGAMGQTQFMPFNFLKFAVDFDGDDRRDIWNSDADALASIANYLHSKGWSRKTGWGVEVAIPDSEDMEALRLEKGEHSLKEWRKRGFLRSDGKKLPRTGLRAHLIIPDDAVSTAYLAFPNYNILMDWNHSIYFATTIGLLADAIGKK
jgi:membrane-bound lytic murein transglycosylase B